MFWNMQKAIINNINCLQLGRYGLSDTVVFSDTVRTKDQNFSEIKEAHSSFLTVSKIEVDIHNQDFKSIDGILYSNLYFCFYKYLKIVSINCKNC